MIGILYFVLLFLVFIGLGRFIIGLFRLEMGSLEELVFSFGIGAATLALIVFFIGLSNLLTSTFFYIFIIILLALFSKSYIKVFYRLKKSFLGCKKERTNFFGMVLILFLAVFLLLLFVSSLSPVIEWDSLAYHLSIPKTYIQERSITYIPYIMNSNWPSLIEMLYLVGILIKSEVLAKLIAYSFLPMLGIGVYSFSRKFFNRKDRADRNVGLIAVTVLVSIPIINQFANITMVDVALALFQFLTIYAFFNWYRSNNNKWIYLAAILAGFAASIKISGFLFIPLILLGILYKKIALDKKTCKGIITAIVFSVISFIIFLPWLIKTYVFTGNPVWPYFFGVFGGRYWTNQIMPYLEVSHSNYGFGKTLIDFIALPWNLTIHSGAFGSIVGLSAVFLVFLPLFIFIKKSRIINYLLIYSLLVAIIWFLVMPQQTRMLLPLIPVFSIIVGYIINHLTKERFLKKIVILVLVLMLCFNLVLSLGINTKKLPVALGLESKENYIEKYVDHYNATKYANKYLPEDSKIFFFLENRGYYLDRAYVWGDPVDQAYVNYFEFKNSEDMLERLREIRVTHILINSNIKIKYGDKTDVFVGKIRQELINPLLAKYTLKIYDENGVAIYRIKENN